MITYVFQYAHWVEAGFSGVLRHIAISGSMAALGCAVCVPICIQLTGRFKTKLNQAFNMHLQPVPRGVLAITIGLWIFGIAAYIT